MEGRLGRGQGKSSKEEAKKARLKALNQWRKEHPEHKAQQKALHAKQAEDLARSVGRKPYTADHRVIGKTQPKPEAERPPSPFNMSQHDNPPVSYFLRSRYRIPQWGLQPHSRHEQRSYFDKKIYGMDSDD